MRACRFFVILFSIITSMGVAQAQYPGIYTGTYSGDESGTWQAVVDDSLNVTGYILSSSGESRTGVGSVSATGGFLMGVVDIGATFAGQIGDSGQMSGSWNSSEYNMSGTYSGSRISEMPQTPYPGTYTGTISGDDTGTFNMIVSDSLTISGHIIPSGGDYYSVVGSVDATTGFFTGTGSIGTFSGQIDNSGQVSGTWNSPEYNRSGTLTGWRTSSPSTAPTITTSNLLPSGTVGSVYSQTLSASGGTMPYTWTISSGSLPPGLTLSSDGVISGTPISVSTATFTVQLTGSNSLSTEKAFNLTILAQRTDINIVSLIQGTNGEVQPNLAAPFTVVAQSASGEPLYYKWFYRANYGTSNYDNAPWVVVQEYSTSATCAYLFPSAGSYIIVVRVVTDPNNEPADLPIIGGVVPVGQNGQIAPTGLFSSATGNVNANSPITFNVIASNSTAENPYYKWFYRASYGSSDYDTSPWIVVQDYAIPNSCSYTFPAAGKYILVVRSVADPNNELSDPPIWGTVVNVQ